MSDLRDKIVPLGRVFPWADMAGIESILALDDEAAIAALVARLSPPSADPRLALVDAVITAVELNDEMRTVAAVAKAFGKSERWLQQTFRDYLGIGLKWLLQRQRLLTAAKHIRETSEPDWAAIAYDLGYSSQQHFITDFRTVLGVTPVQYKKDLAPIMR